VSKARFLYNNLITSESMLAVSSLRAGLVTNAKKEGTGSAVIVTSGNYSGSTDLEYIVEIDSIAAGAEVGQATFRWSDGGGTWNATGVTTPTSATELNNGAKIAFTSGTGADFVVGDRWYFKGVNLFNPGKLIDLDRDHVCRSAALESPNTTTIDLGSAQEVKALVLYDHNITSGATITINGNSANSWGAPAFSESVTWAADKILHYLSEAQTYRYWQLQITDTANTDGYIETGEIFLGSYMELSKNYVEGFKKPFELLFDENKTPYGVSKKRFYNKRRNFQFDFNYILAADIALLETMLDALCDSDNGKINPFYFNDDSAIPANTWLVDITSLPEDHQARGFYSSSLSFTEVLRSL
jgi:hypothetical protein